MYATSRAIVRPALDVRIPAAVVGVAIAVLAGSLYLLLGPSTSGGSMYVPLADAFLHGRLDVPERSWLELVPLDGRWYVPLPPVPALTLMPAVAAMGSQPWHAELAPNVPAAIVGAVNVFLVFALVDFAGARGWTRALLTLGFATATHLWIAGNGGPHHYAQLVAAMFLLGSLNVAVRGRAPLVAGILLGLAAGARLPAGLALPLLLAFYPARAWLQLVAGVGLIAAPVALYNVARFGSPLDFGYARIPAGEGLVTDEPWYADGLLSLSYVPRSLSAALLSGFSVVDRAPYLMPSWSGLSLLLTAPVLFLAVRARGRLALIAGVAVAAVMLPNLAHGAWGFAQYGYRFALDATPIVMLLLAWSYRDRAPDRLLVGAVALGAAANLYGFWAASAGFVQ